MSYAFRNRFLRARLVLIAIFFCGNPAFAQGMKSYVYVESNTGTVPDQNSIFAFSNDDLGNLSALGGSPYLTRGTGVAIPGSSEVNADQQVITNLAGTVLYAVNGHSNTIAAFTINADGTLTALPDSPFASGGQNPVSLGLSGKFLVVANKNLDPTQDIDADVPNYTTFTVKKNGSLRMNLGSTFDLAAGSGPSQALVLGRSHLLFGLELLTSRIATFRWDRQGLLTEAGSIDPTTVNGAFLGEILHPRQRVLYAGLLRTNELGVYTYDSAGALTFIRAVPNDGIDICWLKMNAAGTRLYSSESVTNTLTVYDTSDPLSPVQLQQLALNMTDGPVINLALDPTEKFLYALAGRGLHVLAVDAAGMISENLDPVGLPGSRNDTPLGLAVVRK